MFGRGLRALGFVACVSGAAGCFENEEERALSAYHAHDHAKASRLAEALAVAGNPRGHELLALMASQGLGRETDFTVAMASIDRAVAVDPHYARSRSLILERIDRTARQAADAFEAGDWERAMALAAPLEAFGHEVGTTLVNRLVTGGYVALPGSAMAWRTFWNDCAGNTRRDDSGADAGAFTERCRGKPAVWEGTVSGRKGETVLIRMAPGRPRARYDLALRFREPPDPALSTAGLKVRFRGVIDERGTPSRPDVLVDAALLAPATLTPEEQARALALARGKVAGACRRLLYDRFRGSDAPQWTRQWRESLPDAERERLRLYTFIAIDSPPDAYVREDDGGWRARLAGSAVVQAPNAQMASASDFVSLCRIEPAPEATASADLNGTVAFERLAPPRFEL